MVVVVANEGIYINYSTYNDHAGRYYIENVRVEFSAGYLIYEHA